MHAIETNAKYFGISRLQLMENAGSRVADQIASRFKPTKTRIAIFCGLGGNGGDGLVAARHLLSQGFRIEVVLAGKPTDITSEETRINLNALQSLAGSINIHEAIDSSLIPDVKADVIVDALLGTGLKGTPRPPVTQLISKINAMKAFKVAVDVPSGINSDTGEAFGEAVKADVTITFHKPKIGLEKAGKYVGELVVALIGLPEEFEDFAGPGDVEKIIKPRLPTVQKGDSGRILVIGGSAVFSGAPALVALAAYRAGVDLVHVAAPTQTAYSISSMSADLITVKLEGDHLNPRNIGTLAPYLEKSTTVAMGPGLGLHNDTREAVKQIVTLIEERRIPLLLDADALKAFAEFKHKLRTPAVLTPHRGEYRILTGHELTDDVVKQAEDVEKTAKELGAVILLKGHTDVISDGERCKFNFTGNPGMTVGGTGDVLSGVVAAFMAQGVDPFDAAVAGAFVNGAAGDFVASAKGFHMVATDLLEWIPKAIDDPMSHAKVRRLG
jgi:NAD(P)H-hydrate epimerase